MTRKKLEIEVLPSGAVRSPFTDETTPLVKDLAEDLGATPKVKRASQIEWEDVGEKSGWTVRAQHDPTLGIRQSKDAGNVVSRDNDLPLVVFSSRETALKAELQFFWSLLP
jgi:hypothetical protein